MTNQTSCGKSNTWPKHPVSGCQPGSVPLRNKILYQLDEIYAKTIYEGVYPSALKAVELNIKMLAYMESPAVSLRVADLDTATIERMIVELGGDPSLDRESEPQPQIHQPQAQTPSISVEPPLPKNSQITMSTAAPLSLTDLDKETIQNYSDDLGEEIFQELGLDLPPHPHLHVSSRPTESSINNEDQTITLVHEKEQVQPKKSPSFEQIQRSAFKEHPIQWARKENTQPRSQSGEELRHKPG